MDNFKVLKEYQWFLAKQIISIVEIWNMKQKYTKIDCVNNPKP